MKSGGKEMDSKLFSRLLKILIAVFSVLFVRYVILLELIFSRNYIADYQLAFALPVCLVIGFLALAISLLLLIAKNT